MASVGVDKIINGKLLSPKYKINVYTGPTGTLIKTIPAGQVIGTIYSWVEVNGRVWYELKEGGWVAHGEGYFDKDFLMKSLAEYEAKRQAEIDARAAKRIDNSQTRIAEGVTDSIGNIFTGLKWLIIVVILVALYLAYKHYAPAEKT